MDHFFLPLLLKGLQQVGADLVHIVGTDGWGQARGPLRLVLAASGQAELLTGATVAVGDQICL